MTKQEKIKEAWGYGWEFIDSYKRDDVLYFGWVHILNLNISLDELNITLEQHPNDEWLYRPKSLQGIENNNGWTKIESEDDLPIHALWLSNGKDVWQGNLFEIGVFAERINTLATHYQPIEKPKPPIY